MWAQPESVLQLLSQTMTPFGTGLICQPTKLCYSGTLSRVSGLSSWKCQGLLSMCIAGIWISCHRQIQPLCEEIPHILHTACWKSTGTWVERTVVSSPPGSGELTRLSPVTYRGIQYQRPLALKRMNKYNWGSCSFFDDKWHLAAWFSQKNSASHRSTDLKSDIRVSAEPQSL